MLPTTGETLRTGYIASKVPSKSWDLIGHRKTIKQWVGDDPKYQAETFNSENPYNIMMAHDYTTLPKRGLCPICDGAIPNNETPGDAIVLKGRIVLDKFTLALLNMLAKMPPSSK